MGEPRTAFKPDDRHGLILYDYAGSPCARRVRITLIEKGLGWGTQVIDLSCLEQRNPEYLKLNPNGFVPTLAHGERVIYESNVITEYLDDVFPQQRLYPDDPWELAQVKMWQSAELAMAKDYRTLMYQRLMGPIVRLTRTLDEALAAARRSTTDAADLAWEERVWGLNVLTDEEERQYEDRLWKWLDVIEQQLDGRDYLVGNRLTQAEVSLLPRVMMYAFVQQPITAERHPNVRRWMDHLSRRPSFATTLSPQDAGLLRLSRTPVMPWLQRTLRKPEVERTWSERLRLAVAKRFFGRVTAGRGVTEDAHAGQPRAILQPRNGTVPPAVLSTRAPRPPSPETLAQPITLYDYPHSPHGRRIRILLLEKGLRWQTVDIDMGRMAHKAPDYLAVNPNGELPAIRHGDRVLYDSQLIAEYLDHIYRANPLYPDDAYLTAQVRMWLALEAGTHKEFRPLFYLHVIRPELLQAGLGAADVDRIVPAGVHPSFKEWLRDTLNGTHVSTPPKSWRGPSSSRSSMCSKTGSPAVSTWSVSVSPWPTPAGSRASTACRHSASLCHERYPNIQRWCGRAAERPSLAASARN